MNGIICRLANDGGRFVAGSVERKCELCGAAVMVSHASLKLAAEKSLTIACANCAAKDLMQQGSVELMGPTPEQLRELKLDRERN